MIRTDMRRKPVMIALALFLTINIGLVLGAGLPWVSGVTNPTPRVNLAVYGIYNSNFTGVLDSVYGYLRNVPSQLVHSNFLLNSNSCASCHLTHLAPGENRLFQRSVYNTCTSCHFDDINNTYNVLTGTFRPGGGLARAGGRFFDGDFPGLVAGRAGVSFHLATGAVEHWQAPGSGFTSRPDTLPASSPWLQRFTCGSCHAPHSSFSGRHLHFNVNGRAPRFGPVALETVAGEVYLVPSAHRERTPWLHYDPEHPLAATHGVVITNALGAIVTHAFRVHNQLGQVTLVNATAAGAGPYHVSWSQATLTGIEVQNVRTVAETVYLRNAVANFCASCHISYRVRPNQRAAHLPAEPFYTVHASVYPFEHPIGTDIGPHVVSGFVYAPPARFRLEESGGQRRLTCLSCHFAHGTDTALMTRRNLSDPAYPGNAGIPPQTRLLRFGNGELSNPNREVCMACHSVMPAATLIVTRAPNVVNSNIHINFDRRVDMNTVSTGANGTLRVFEYVYNPVLGVVQSTLVSGSVYQINEFRTVVFAPTTALNPGSDYSVEVTTGVLSWFGRALASTYYSIVTR